MPHSPIRIQRRLAVALGLAVAGAAAFGSAPPPTTILARLDAPGGRANDFFGGESSLAVYGDTVIASNWQANRSFVYRRQRSVWQLDTELTVPGSDAPPLFGRSPSLQGDTAVIPTLARETVFVFARSGGVWSLQQEISNPAADEFGISTALDGDTLLVGADSESGQEGRVHVYTRSGTVWTEQAVLQSDAPSASAFFGFQVALRGNLALVSEVRGDVTPGGNEGRVHVFRRSGNSWGHEAVLVADDGGANEEFGNSLAIGPGYAAVGAYRHSDAAIGEQSGAVYIYRNTVTTWSAPEHLAIPDAAAFDQAGQGLACDGALLLVGVPGRDGRGAVVSYEKNGTNLVYSSTLEAPEGGVSRFGGCVASHQGTTAIGAPPTTVDGHDFQGVVFLAGQPEGQYVVPSKVAVKVNAAQAAKSSVTFAGVLNVGTVEPDFSRSLQIQIGGLQLYAPSLRPSGKAFTYKGGGLSLKVVPGKKGSSKTTISLKYTGDLGGQVPLDGPLPVQFLSSSIRADAAPTLTKGKFASGKGPGALADPAFQLTAFSAKLKGDGKDSLAVSAVFAADGTAPAVAPDVALDLGAASFRIDGTDPGFERSGETWTWTGAAPGLTKVVIDYVKGTVSLKGSKVSLGTFGEGTVDVGMTLALDTDTADLAITAVRAGANLKY